MRKNVIALLSALSVLSGVVHATEFMTKDAALKEAFGKDAKVTAETKELKDPQLSKVVTELGGTLEFRAKGSSVKPVTEPKAPFEFYFATKDGKKTGVAFIDSEPGKWGNVVVCTSMDMTGKIKRVDILDMSEKRGQPITRRTFLSQFEGKSAKDRITVRKDITGITGATLSASCAAFAVKKSALLYDALYLGK